MQPKGLKSQKIVVGYMLLLAHESLDWLYYPISDLVHPSFYYLVV
jgi:hypothetical protein